MKAGTSLKEQNVESEKVSRGKVESGKVSRTVVESGKDQSERASLEEKDESENVSRKKGESEKAPTPRPPQLCVPVELSQGLLAGMHTVKLYINGGPEHNGLDFESGFNELIAAVCRKTTFGE